MRAGKRFRFRTWNLLDYRLANDKYDAFNETQAPFGYRIKRDFNVQT